MKKITQLKKKNPVLAAAGRKGTIQKRMLAIMKKHK